MPFQRSYKHLLVTKRFYYETHYDVLKLKNDCTQKDVKKAFITLSKEFHPDKQNNINTHDKFVKILDAYKILSQPGTRAAYDLGLSSKTSNIPPSNNAYYHYPDEVRRSWNDPTFYPNRKRTHHQDMPRSVMYKMFGGFIVLSLGVYFFTLWRFFCYHSKNNDKWRLNGMKLAEVRKNALEKGDEAQIKDLMSMASRKVE